MTASASADEKADCLHAGMNDILSKPFSEEDLSRLLVSWLAGAPTKRAAKTGNSTLIVRLPSPVRTENDMTTLDLENVNVSAFDAMPTPEELHARLPLSLKATRTVTHGRDALRKILDRRTTVSSPSSAPAPSTTPWPVSTTPAACTTWPGVSDTILLVMRVYFEKPLYHGGLEGLHQRPFMDDSFRVDIGMEKARDFLLQVNELGLPTGTEALDPISPQYYGDLISWTAIGARTTESQTHREMSSGLSPVGFKNGTSGDLGVAVNAILSASKPHSFLGINGQGRVTIVRTSGNRHGHVVLRGGDRPNYDTVSVSIAEQALTKAKLPANIVVDCSHANSSKKPELQPWSWPTWSIKSAWATSPWSAS